MQCGGHVEFERQESAEMRAKQLTVQVHVGRVCGRVEPQYHALSGDQARGYGEAALIDHPTVVRAQAQLVVLVIVGARYGHRQRLGQGSIRPFSGV